MTSSISSNAVNFSSAFLEGYKKGLFTNVATGEKIQLEALKQTLKEARLTKSETALYADYQFNRKSRRSIILTGAEKDSYEEGNATEKEAMVRNFQNQGKQIANFRTFHTKTPLSQSRLQRRFLLAPNNGCPTVR